MRLTRIAARDFMGFAELDRDLSTSSNVVIVGKNGHGKSTVYDVVRYALFGKGRFRSGMNGGSPDQQVRHGTERLWTCVEFETPDGRQVRVERSKALGKTASIGVWVEGEDVTEVAGRKHTNAETDALIEQLIGMPYALITAGPWMAQEEASALMSAQAADRLRMFVRLFDAEWCAPLHDDAKAERDAHERTRSMAAARIAELDEVIAPQAEVESRREELTLSLNTLRDRDRLATDQLATIREQIAAAAERSRQRTDLLAREQRLTGLIATAEGEVVRLNGAIARASELLSMPMPVAVVPEEPATEADIERVERRVEVVNAARTRAATLRSQARNAQQRVVDLEHDRGLLAEVPCGGVGDFAACQFLTRVPAADAIESMKATVAEAFGEADAADATVAEGEHLPDVLSKMRRDRATYQSAVADAALATQRYESMMRSAQSSRDESTAMLASVRDRIAADSAERERYIAERAAIDAELAVHVDIQEVRAQIETVLANVHRKIAEVEPELRRIEAKAAVIAKAIEDRPGWVAREAEAEAQAAIFDRLVKAFHPTGIPTLVVENGIALIEERVNELLSHLPDDFRIEMRTQREKRGGGISDALDIIVMTKGWETPYEFLSVGQRFRVDLALRVGLSEVLAMRRGTRIETLWLDEPLADLDDEGREAVADVLATLTADFGLVVVVSHHPDYNDRADVVMRVWQGDDGISHDSTEEAA